MLLKKATCTALVVSSMMGSACAVAAHKTTTGMEAQPGHHTEHAHWGYQGDTAPAHWSGLDDQFSLCGTGVNQSPINLTEMTSARLADIHPAYARGGTEVLNNGHTIQVNYSNGSSLDIDGKTFALKQFHFHSPSENTINGEHFPMEAHLVHAADDGSLAVVAIMFREGEFNSELEKAWSQMPQQAGEKQLLKKPVNVQALMPEDLDYYRFNGSLTTPPCSEGVRWLVLKQPVTASAQQLETFRSVMGHPNNRPVQPLNARQVYQ